ncbi:MAG: carbon storage regulator CsrA [Candidatus Melainabacteria bacterium]|nr:carbon storage regulator CsrA [Candidatus Melainabacteria bacterium]
MVLTRKPGQTILIGDNISIKVLNVKGDNVRLGIDAPPEIPVHRSEIQERIERERG